MVVVHALARGMVCVHRQSRPLMGSGHGSRRAGWMMPRSSATDSDCCGLSSRATGAALRRREAGDGRVSERRDAE